MGPRHRVFWGSQMCRSAVTFENHCFSLSIPSSSHLKVFSQTFMEGHGRKTRKRSVSWANPELRAGPEIDKVCYLHAPVTGQKCEECDTFPKANKFFKCKAGHGPSTTRKSVGRSPLETTGSKHPKSFSFCGSGYRAYKCSKASSAKKKVH